MGTAEQPLAWRTDRQKAAAGARTDLRLCLRACSSANAALRKLYNWSCLNKKVFKRLGFVLTKAECEAVCTCQPGAVERVLKLLQVWAVHAEPELCTGQWVPHNAAALLKSLLRYPQLCPPPQRLQ